MCTAMDVANYFLLKDHECRQISNLKLQKLLYYAQGCSLALFGKPIFKGHIVAWMHGPVVVDIYNNFKMYGKEIIDCPHIDPPKCFQTEEQELLDEVYEVFGKQFSAWELRDKTHSESPWIITWDESRGAGAEITNNCLTDYFETQLISQ